GRHHRHGHGGDARGVAAHVCSGHMGGRTKVSGNAIACRPRTAVGSAPSVRTARRSPAERRSMSHISAGVGFLLAAAPTPSELNDQLSLDSTVLSEPFYY